MSTPWERRRNNQAPADPRFPYQAPLAAGQVANTNANTGRTVVQTQGDITDNQTKKATQPYAIQKARNEAMGLSPEIIAARKDKAVSLNNFGGIIDDLENQYRQSFKGAGGTSGRGRFAEWLPGNLMGRTVNEANDRFNSAGNQAGSFITNILGLGAKGTDAAAEYERKVVPFLPQAGDSDAKIEDKLKRLRALHAEQARSIGMALPRAPANAPRKAAPVIDFNKWGK